MRILALKLIRFYQRCPFFHLPIFKTLFLTDSVCRFQPTCSEYAYQAVERYGIMRGSALAVKRILRCHPWSEGGLDPLVGQVKSK